MNWRKLIIGLTCGLGLITTPLLMASGEDTGVAHRVAALEDQVTTLMAEITELEDLLSGISRFTDDFGYDTLRFSGMNVQIVNGTGWTDLVNGTGNLSIGYNELRDECLGEIPECNPRDGSHNLVLGWGNNYTAVSGIVAGYWHEISGQGASIVGGLGNVADGHHTFIGGGADNTTSGGSSSIIGGHTNMASGTYASISGGANNISSGSASSVSGGFENTASGTVSSVSGGRVNFASGPYASVSGGARNMASWYQSAVSGGVYNDSVGSGTSISGGQFNVAGGAATAISGGDHNYTWGLRSSISGGYFNTATGEASSVSGGDHRDAVTTYCWEGGSIIDC